MVTKCQAAPLMLWMWGSDVDMQGTQEPRPRIQLGGLRPRASTGNIRM